MVSAALYLLAAASFSVFYNTSKFFNIALATIISLAAYFTYLFYIGLALPFMVAATTSIIFSIMISIVCELFIYRYMRSKNLSSFTMLIASIGLYTVLQNLISVFWGDDTKVISRGAVKPGHEILGAYITGTQVSIVFVSAGVFIGLLFLLYRTPLGQQIRAVAGNFDLCNIYGVNSNKVILFATVISAGLAALAGILISLNVDMRPTIGFNYFLYGVVAMIIGGVGSYRGLILGSVLLATAQNLAAWYLDSKWMDAIAYIILILFLIWKPLGFSGQRLKKVEV